ncbi:Sugar phosphate isomerase/epimerase [Cognatiyoonia koreensis]|uniref:Sugar phosphate isomerase/epimerase n=1 Tax=Cognatiyoonia koreensis TaxID=364200 RepID=A0A1I0RVX0_9RHOB|nr:sugar phosphate isomerase/epimerase [Cognatiyoonia koreensis]SEW45682.1 Sugar phosphate isomerase/epimerase [Cognatiyoonia koreensis]
MTQVSYQLYCSRNFPPLTDTCKMLAETGYREVEGYGGLLDDLDGLKAALDQNGLRMTSCHVGLDMIESNPQMLLDLAGSVGLEKVFVPYLAAEDRPVDSEGWRAYATRVVAAGKPLRDASLGFGWHNHDFEFIKTGQGDRPEDLLAEAGLALELDLGWVARAGLDPVDMIKNYGDKIIAAHIKDLAPAGENADEDGWADVGHGVQNWGAIHAALQDVGCTHYVVEHDNPKDHARFAARSLATVQSF